MAVVSNNKIFRWVNGIVPFEISKDFPEGSEGRKEILQAINEINVRTNCSFIERTTEPNYVVFVYDAKWCQSYVGMLGGRQEIRCAIGKNFKAGSLIHEVLHALGFYHEHQRPDRDEYIRVVKSNIKRLDDFQILNSEIVETIGEYDFSSIMHYPRRIVNPNLVNNISIDTIEPLKALPLETILGQRGALSSKDVAAINQMYPKKAMNTKEYSMSEPIKAWQLILIITVSATLLYITVRKITT
ncbi:hypothetical protein GCM10011514_16860 [Emticicia aquatilis]|uniref:Peptidase M12A domain-containing protein n=1 Tax=Emticicia aquatilis TaxID=1537369 RepID=A0A917DNA0_9BACT|nr:M12 family metallopeptidase [Emticicia aquatilis]GGD53368.1 hypothetical protein GCM10011514_16860 [Emticicia aquatilis]